MPKSGSSIMGMLTFIGGILVGHLGYAFYRHQADKTERRLKRETRIAEVLFFPDKGLPCPKFFSANNCGDIRCKFLHENTSLHRIIYRIKNTKHSLDICMYLLTLYQIGTLIIELFNDGVKIRVITDSDMGETRNIIGSFKSQGIPVRSNKNRPGLMHHKFLIIDDELLLTGSANWTNEGFLNNWENVIITNEDDYVHPFKVEFNKMWDDFNPQRRN